MSRVPRAVSVAIPVVALIVVAGTASVFLRPAPSGGFGPEARVMDCAFDGYCRGADCAGALPVPAQLVTNGYRSRNYLIWGRPLGQATTLPGESATVYAAPTAEEIWAVFTLTPDRRFDFRLTERLIDAPGFETGHGQCSDPAPMTEET